MTRKAMASVLFVAGLAASALAAKGDNQKLLGAWERKINDNQFMKLTFKADDLHATVTGADSVVDVDADYGVTAAGVLYAIVTHVDRKGTEAGPAEGEMFNFHFTVSDAKDSLKIRDLKGSEITDETRQLFEGDYAPEKKK